jgi:hypothetical protein
MGDKMACVAYIDARDVMNALDELVGAENWQTHHAGHVGKLFCELSIKIGDEWITKSDAGMDTQIAADKGAASDAFKRAAVAWGLGRYIYELPTVLMPFTQGKNGKDYLVDSAGKYLMGDRLNQYINTYVEQGKLETI